MAGNKGRFWLHMASRPRRRTNRYGRPAGLNPDLDAAAPGSGTGTSSMAGGFPNAFTTAAYALLPSVRKEIIVVGSDTPCYPHELGSRRLLPFGPERKSHGHGATWGSIMTATQMKTASVSAGTRRIGRRYCERIETSSGPGAPEAPDASERDRRWRACASCSVRPAARWLLLILVLASAVCWTLPTRQWRKTCRLAGTRPLVPPVAGSILVPEGDAFLRGPSNLSMGVHRPGI